MDIVLIVGLFCALIFFMNHEKSNPPVQLPPSLPALPNNDQNKILELEKNLCKKEEKISNLNENLSEKEAEIDKLKNTLSEKGNEVLKLNSTLHEQKVEILRLRSVLQERDKEIKKLNKFLREKDMDETPTISTEKRFVSVIFDATNPESTFDYLMGDIVDLKIGDIVLVPVRKSKIEKNKTDKDKTGPKLARAIVKYISKPDEVSSYARSPIIKKLNEKTW